MEGDVAFDLLQHLVDMAVKDRHGAEPLQAIERLRAVLRCPAPLRIDGPKRDVREDDDRRAGGEAADVILEPGDLFLAEAGQTARLEIDDIDQPDEMNALAVEAIPAGALRALSVTLHVRMAIIQPVVLAWNVMDLAMGPFDD